MSTKTGAIHLSHLKQRGLKGVQLIISDACLGLVESVGDYYPKADWQRCMVHFYRNVFSHVPSTKVKQVRVTTWQQLLAHAPDIQRWTPVAGQG